MADRVLDVGGEKGGKSRQNPKWLLYKRGRQSERSDKRLRHLGWPGINAPGRKTERSVIQKLGKCSRAESLCSAALKVQSKGAHPSLAAGKERRSMNKRHVTFMLEKSLLQFHRTDVPSKNNVSGVFHPPREFQDL